MVEQVWGVGHSWFTKAPTSPHPLSPKYHGCAVPLVEHTAKPNADTSQDRLLSRPVRDDTSTTKCRRFYDVWRCRQQIRSEDCAARRGVRCKQRLRLTVGGVWRPATRSPLRSDESGAATIDPRAPNHCSLLKYILFIVCRNICPTDYIIWLICMYPWPILLQINK